MRRTKRRWRPIPESDLGKAQGRALRLLAVRDRTNYELTERLLKAGFSEDLVAEVVAWCRHLGYVDDARFARHWIEYRTLHSPSGRRRLSLELRQKGVDDETIEAALEELLPRDKEQELCIAAALRRARRYQNDPQDVRERRLASFLARRGFSYDLIRTALAQVDSHSDTD